MLDKCAMSYNPPVSTYPIIVLDKFQDFYILEAYIYGFITVFGDIAIMSPQYVQHLIYFGNFTFTH